MSEASSVRRMERWLWNAWSTAMSVFSEATCEQPITWRKVWRRPSRSQTCHSPQCPVSNDKGRFQTLGNGAGTKYEGNTPGGISGPARGGATSWTFSGQQTCRTDLPLTVEGEEHARRLGERLKGLKFAKVFTSPLQRAARTCELAGFGAVAETDPD